MTSEERPRLDARRRGSAGGVYRFGDLLALAREVWVREMSAALLAAGFADYRRSDASVLRQLARGPVAVGQVGRGIGTSRQAARKMVDGLVRRGYAAERPAVHDGRVVEIALTPLGEAYARAVVATIGTLNEALVRSVSAADLVAADRVLRRVVAADPSVGDAADRIARPSP